MKTIFAAALLAASASFAQNTPVVWKLATGYKADSIPFVVTSYADAKRMWDLQRPGLEREMAQRGFKLLYAVPWPPQGLYLTKPLKDISDFTKKVKENPSLLLRRPKKSHQDAAAR